MLGVMTTTRDVLGCLDAEAGRLEDGETVTVDVTVSVIDIDTLSVAVADTVSVTDGVEDGVGVVEGDTNITQDTTGST